MMLALLAACTGRTDRAPYLCCVLTCTGGLVNAHKEAPENVDGRWHCARGQPIGYESSCTPEDVSECEEDTPDQNTNTGGSDGGRDGG